MRKIFTYNVNGLRAAANKGFFDWMSSEDPDIVCLQEIKMQDDQVPDEWRNPEGYEGHWHFAGKRGYSGLAVFSRQKPLRVTAGMGMDKYDSEGRVLRLDFPEFTLLNTYFPSGSSGDLRQQFKEEFLVDYKKFIDGLKATVPRLLICGDFNICHREIDIHDPVRNKTVSGFLPHERQWMTELLESGFVDSFRMFHSEGGQYSWWSYRSAARQRNKGWRLDYHMLSDSLAKDCVGADIHQEAVHSDHCPASVVLNF
jgi:exodeoxyribonuclease-3